MYRHVPLYRPCTAMYRCTASAPRSLVVDLSSALILGPLAALTRHQRAQVPCSLRLYPSPIVGPRRVSYKEGAE